MFKNLPIGLSVLVFVVGACRSYDLNVIGRMPLGEIVAFATIPFFILKRRAFSPSEKKRLFVVCGAVGLWLLGVIISDVLVQNVFLSFLRGALKPLFCVLWMLFFVGIVRKDYRLIAVLPFGFVVASIQNFLFPQGWTAQHLQSGGYGKIVYGYTPMIVAVVLACATLVYFRSRVLSVLSGVLFIGLGVIVALLGGSRSAAGVAALVGLVIFCAIYIQRKDSRNIRRMFSKSKLILMAALLVLMSVSIYYVYVYGASEGMFGEAQRKKIEDQGNTIFGRSPIGLLLDGRAPVYGAILAILDNPYSGYGSWSGVGMADYYYDAVVTVGTDAREIEEISESFRGGSVGHSIYFGVWLENGLIAMIGMLVLMSSITKVFVDTVRFPNILVPILSYLYIGFLWSFLFSPFGTSHRMVVGLFFALYILGFPRLNIQNRSMGIMRV